MHGRGFRNAAVAITVTLAVASCGGSDSGTPTAPGNNSGGTGTTITIGANGVVSPRELTVAVGSRVTFVNNHSAAHEMTSDPHPDHTQCPPLNQVGHLTTGQSRTSGNLNTPGVCGFHDHLNDTNNNLKGTIRVQ